MEAQYIELVASLPLWTLFIGIAICIFLLGTGADTMVENAVSLSTLWGVPPGIVGATIVSLGTTFPEAAVSVAAAVQGEPDIALGNAVGSIICDTGLILGIANCMSPLLLEKEVVGRQGWIQIGAGFLLVATCFPYSSPATAFETGGHLPRLMGFVFLLLLALYMTMSIVWARQSNATEILPAKKEEETSVSRALIKLFLGALMVIVSSKLLIPMVRETALRLSVPESIVGATLVAFGTSLPELVTAVTAVRKGHGELAVGNVLGADILNVLFVAGAAAAVTPGGLIAPPQFFSMLFPAMLAVLIVFRVGVMTSGPQLKRPFGIVLLAVYIAVTVISYRDVSLVH